MKTQLACMLLLCLFVQLGMAQNPDKELTTKLVLAQDDVRLKNYRAATHSLHWLLTNAPDHNEAIYIMAYKAYEHAAEDAVDSKEKEVLLDSMLTVYLLKEQQFKLTRLEENNLAFRYYKYFKNDPVRLKEGFARFQKLYNSAGSIVNNNLAAYMALARSYHQNVQPLELNDLSEIREQIVSVIDRKLKNGADQERMSRNQAIVDQLFNELIDGRITCEYLSELSKNLDRENVAAQVVGWSLDAGCTGERFFTDALEVLVKQDTTNIGAMKILAKKAAASEKYDKAIGWYQKIIPLEDTDVKKAADYLDLARVYALKSDKPQARAAAFKAVELDDTQLATAYSFVANLYMSSFDDCAEKNSIIEDRALFMAAYDLFKQAGNMEGMQAAQAQFPTRSQAHTEDLYEGNELAVGCWINVKTLLKTRPSQ